MTMVDISPLLVPAVVEALVCEDEVDAEVLPVELEHPARPSAARPPVMRKDLRERLRFVWL